MSPRPRSKPLEKQVADDQAEHDAATNGAGDELFDANRYNDPKLALAHDGRPITGFAIAFSGTVTLERWLESNVELWKRLRAGNDVELTITASIRGDSHTFKPPNSKRSASYGAQRTLWVHSIDGDPRVLGETKAGGEDVDA